MPYDDSQPRDKSGMWTSGGSSGLPPSAYAAGMAQAPTGAGPLSRKSGGAEQFQRLNDLRDSQVAGDPVRAAAMQKYLHGGEGGFADINAQLRQGGTSDVADTFAEMAIPFSQIDGAANGDGYVYRGISSADLLKGGTLVEKGLLSTSTNPEEAANFATQRRGKNAVLRLRPAAGMSAVVGATPQREVVFLPGSTIRVLSRSVQPVKFSGDYGTKNVTLIDAVLEGPHK